MFKKLKDKITEEVKSSPQRFQQLTQSVSDRLQNSATSDENFFSIGEDDANMSTNTEPGFSNVSLMSPQENKTRRNSSSSVASDVSFLPRYESLANMYHLQSDLEISASEMEDNASTSSQLGHLSKEQIYSAFQKAQMRYHKYRGRYTDLAKHYKDLERENAKMKSVLVETQDKAIRRVTELKEQCALEQKAKAHLEAALRDEIDEKQFKIQSLQTKIELLQTGNGSLDQNSETLDTLNKYLTEARQEIENLNGRLQEMKANSIIFQTKELEYKTKIASLEREVSQFSDRERENNLSLAQSKMELHNEILTKDAELASLKKDNELLKQNLDALNTGSNKMENLQTQNKKLIEKMEALNQKCKTYESDLVKMEQYRIELHSLNQANSELKGRLKEAEDRLEQVREEAKHSLLSLEGKIRDKLHQEFETKEAQLRDEFRRTFEQISSKADDLQDIQLKLVQNDEEIRILQEQNRETGEKLATKEAKYDDLERNHLELIEDSVTLRSRISTLEKELSSTQNQYQVANMKISHLEENLHILEEERESYQYLEQQLISLEEDKVNLSQKLQISQDLVIKSQRELAVLREEKEDLYHQFQVSQQDIVTKLQKSEQVKSQTDQDLDDARALLQEHELALAQKEELGQKWEEERRQLLHKLAESESSVKKLEEVLEEFKHTEEELVLVQEEKRKLVEILSFNEDQVRNLKQVNAKLSNQVEDLEEWKTKGEEVAQKLETKEVEVQKLTETKGTLAEKVHILEQEQEKLVVILESERQVVKNLGEVNGQLGEDLANLRRQLEEQQAHQTLQLKIKEEKMTDLETRLGQLEVKLAENEELLRRKNEELSTLDQDRQRLTLEIGDQVSSQQQRNDSIKSEMRKLQEEKGHLVEEVGLMKKLLEETNNSLTIKEHELRRIEELYSDSEQKIEKMAKELDNYKKIERELAATIHKYEVELASKTEQIEAVTRKIEEYNEMMEEKSEGFFQILSKLKTEPPNNFRRRDKDNKNLQNLEEKLQNFEHTFCVEKESLAKILQCLKQFEDRYSVLVLEKEQLVADKQGLVEEIGHLQGQVQEITRTSLENSTTKSKEIEDEMRILKEENFTLSAANEKLKQNILELESRNNQVVSDSNYLSEENQSLITELEELKVNSNEFRTKYDSSRTEIEGLKKDIGNLEEKLGEFVTHQQQVAELERHLSELQHEKQLLQDEIQELKISPINVENGQKSDSLNQEKYLKEMESLRDKLSQYKSLDLTNRSSIEFYENELQKLKNQNEKLNRKLDETLVTLNHCAELSNSTEIEYLKNVLYNYMLGKESLVLARVIAAVCKFDQHQTDTIMAKEQQKQTLLGQLGIL